MKKILLFGTIALSLNAYSQVPAYVPSNGLIGWWPFSGNSNDESGNGNNGVDNGPVLTADRFGSANNAYSFDGMDDLIAVATEAIGPLGSADRAISFWARTSYSGSSMTPVDYGNFSAAGPSTFRIQIDNGFCPGISIDYSTLWTSNGINSLIDSNWHHYVVIIDQNIGITHDKFIAYVDGVMIPLACTSTPSTIINTTGGLGSNTVFGANEAGDDFFFNGDLDDIAMWDRALDSCEVQALFTGVQCNVGLEELLQSEKELVKIIDLMGRETEFKPNTPLIFVYSDGTRERVMKLEE